MTYLIAAYLIGAGGVLAYAACILRERRALRAAISQGEESNRG
jgi:hypothetical protein